MARELFFISAMSLSAGQSLDADVILRKHNVYRCMHGVPLLKWNTAIAAQAQSWADTIKDDMRHGGTGPVAGYPGVGQNLWWWAGPPSMGSGLDVSSGADSWYAEMPKYHGQSSWKEAGHYSQMIWKDSAELGCGLWHGNTASNKEVVQLVCDYGPWGNVMGAFDANVRPLNGKSKAQCEAEVDGGSGGGASCASNPGCSGLGLQGNCCPTDSGVKLGCCGGSPTPPPPPPHPHGDASCANNAGCSPLGLEGNCCPTDDGVTLGCCGGSVFEVIHSQNASQSVMV